MKIFVVLALIACACADDTLPIDLTLGGIEDHGIIPPPPGFDKGGLIDTLGSRLLAGEVGVGPKIMPFTRGLETPLTPLPIVRAEYFDAPIYSSPPLSLLDHEKVGVVPTSNYYTYHGHQYVVVPPSRTQPISSPLKSFVGGTPSSGELLYSHAAPATTGVTTTTGYKYLYSPAPVGVHTGGVIPTIGTKYLYSPPEGFSGVIPTTGTKYLYSPPEGFSGVIPTTGTKYLYSPPEGFSGVIPTTGTKYLYTPPEGFSGVIPTTGTKYLYSPPEGFSGVIPTTGTKYLYSPPEGFSGVIPTTGTKYLYTRPEGFTGTIPTTETKYLYSPPQGYTGVIPTHEGGYVYSPPAIGTTGDHFYPSVPLVKVLSGVTPEVEHIAVPEHKFLTSFRETTPNHPRNGASVYYAKWQ